MWKFLGKTGIISYKTEMKGMNNYRYIYVTNFFYNPQRINKNLVKCGSGSGSK